MLKASRYNIFIPQDDDKYLVYNGYTGSLAQIDNNQYQQYQNYIEHGTPLEPEFEENFVYGGFLVYNETDERQLIRERLMHSRYNPLGLTLTIAPTLKCNFCCPYCYEQGAELTGSMSPEIQDSLVEFIEKQCGSIRRLGITWYGGEPLLAPEVIQRISEKVLALAKKYDLKYESRIVTNGYLLTRELVQQLKASSISGMQITLDGPPETHDQRRILHNGTPTFYTILENIKAVCDLITISIRVNVDKHNMDQCDQIMEILSNAGLRGKVGVYFASVDSRHDSNIEERCFTHEAFSAENILLRKKLSESGFGSFNYPLPKANYCGADRLNSAVIDPLGYMYKCWSDIGRYDKAIGRIGTSMSTIAKLACHQNQLDFMMFDPTADEECANCQVLPLCMGGCPLFRRNKIDYCDEVKYQLAEILKNVVQYGTYKRVNERFGAVEKD